MPRAQRGTPTGHGRALTARTSDVGSLTGDGPLGHSRPAGHVDPSGRATAGSVAGVRETADELVELQGRLDDALARGGEHLRDTLPPDWSPPALEVCDRLQGMCLATLSTVTSDGRPIGAPVDGFFVHGRWWFGTAHSAVRLRHIARSPWVSITHVPSEQFALTVHGTAALVDLTDPSDSRHADVREVMLDFYVPRHGEAFADNFTGAAQYVRVDPVRVIAYRQPA